MIRKVKHGGVGVLARLIVGRYIQSAVPYMHHHLSPAANLTYFISHVYLTTWYGCILGAAERPKPEWDSRVALELPRPLVPKLKRIERLNWTTYATGWLVNTGPPISGPVVVMGWWLMTLLPLGGQGRGPSSGEQPRLPSNPAYYCHSLKPITIRTRTFCKQEVASVVLKLIHTSHPGP
jgi:hypothetical protein